MKTCTVWLAIFLLLLPSAWAEDRFVTSAKQKNGPGLLQRNKLRYYLPPVDSRLRNEKQIPPIDLVSLKRPWSEDVRSRLAKINFFDGWRGGGFGGLGAATRYEIAFLLGKLCEAVNMRFGEVFPVRLQGPRRVRLPQLGWGSRHVRLGVRSGLFPVRGGYEWWLKPLTLGRFIRFLEKIARKLRQHTPVFSLPLRFPPRGAGSGVPVPPDPRFKNLRLVYRLGLYDIKDHKWDVRDYVKRTDVILAMDRLVFIAWGYREPTPPKDPDGEYPIPD